MNDSDTRPPIDNDPAPANEPAVQPEPAVAPKPSTSLDRELAETQSAVVRRHESVKVRLQPGLREQRFAVAGQ